MKNCIVVTMDSVRADHSSLYRYSKETNPFLTSLDGALFETAYANAPYTPASVPSLLTSKYPLEDGHIAYKNSSILPEFFNETEYTTGLIYNNVQIERFGFDERFDESVSHTGAEEQSHAEQDRGNLIHKKILKKSKGVLKQYKPVRAGVENVYHRFRGVDQPHPTDTTVTQSAIEWMNRQTEPFVLWVHYMDTHHPYHFEREDFEAVSSYEYDPHRYARLQARACHHIQSGDFVWSLTDEEREYVRDAYDASIRHLDRQIEKLFTAVDQSETITILTADHGEELWDRGHFGHAARPEKPRDMTLYDEMIRVPLLITGPDVPDTSISQPVSLVDVLPTVLRATGVHIPDDLRGRSMSEYYHEDIKDPTRQIIAQATSPGDPKGWTSRQDSYALTAIVQGDYKYHYYEGKNDELFDISEDKRETQNKIDEYPDIARELCREARNWISQMHTGDTGIADSRVVEEQLQDLGYR